MFAFSLFFFFFIHTQQLLGESVLFITGCALFITVLHTVHQKKKLKMGPMTLFTHLKIILLQFFQFSIFSFSKNKLYPNGPLV